MRFSPLCRHLIFLFYLQLFFEIKEKDKKQKLSKY